MDYSRILETYSLEEILEMNDLTCEEVLEFLVVHRYVDLPNYLPIDL